MIYPRIAFSEFLLSAISEHRDDPCITRSLNRKNWPFDGRGAKLPAQMTNMLAVSARSSASLKNGQDMKFNLVRHFADQVVWLHDRIGYVDLFLSRDEVSFVTRELQYAYWRPSPTYQAMPDGTRRDVVNTFRKSESAYYHWFTPKLSEFLTTIDRRISRAFRFKPECLEPWQATRYKPGGSFEVHRDSGYWSDDPAGERITTFLLHLIAADIGGATSFRALGLDVPAAPGR